MENKVKLLQKLSIYQKIVIVMLLVGLIPILTTYFFVNARATKIIQEQTISNVKALQSAKAIDIENNIDSIKEKIKATTDLNIVKKIYSELKAYHDKMKTKPKGSFPINTSEYKKMYKTFHEEIKTFANDMGFEDLYLICSAHGHIMFSLKAYDDLGTNLRYGKYKDTSLAFLWNKIVRTGKGAIVDFESYPPLNNEQVAFIGAPLKDTDGKMIGVLITTLPYKDYMKVVQVRKGLGKSGESYIVGVGRDGKTYLRSNRTVKKGKIGDPKSDKIIKKCLFEGKSGVEEKIGSTGNVEIDFYTPLKINGLKWGLFTTIKKDELLAPVHKLGNILLSFIFLTVVIIIIVSIIFGKQIVKPIKRMIVRAQDLATGEADLTKRVVAENQDELGELANWFNKFIERIQEIISEVKSNASVVSSASTELSSTSEELTATTEEQNAQAASVASAMEELTATIEDNQRMVEQAQDNVSNMENVMNETSSTILQITNSIGDIAGKFENLATMINDFGESAKGIGEILSVITDIADQTNLLALNAAIEAARAGEAGRGFAVVADEIRKLAERTAKSTKEIEEITKKIQVGAENAVSAMDVSLKEVIKGQDLAYSGKSMIERLIEESRKVQEVTIAVSTATTEQAATVKEVNSNIQHIAQASEQSKIAISQIATTSNDLAQQAENLRELVDKFKTE